MPITQSLLERQAQHLRDLEEESEEDEEAEESEEEEQDEYEDDVLPMPEGCDIDEVGDMYNQGTFLK